MKTSIFTAILLMAFAVTINAQDAERMTESCTSIMVGKRASADGSVITSHTCDARYRTWMEVVPARDYERDTVTAVYKNRFHTVSAKDSTNMPRLGVIPQVRHTYRFLDTAYPCLNEKQLAMGETTISGRDTLRNKNGIFMIEELSRIALERCTTARDAIRLMGQLVKKYGYGDSGECLTIADKATVTAVSASLLPTKTKLGCSRSLAKGPRKWAACGLPCASLTTRWLFRPISPASALST